jgi:hypothetical protein
MPPDKMQNQRSPEPHSMDAVATLAQDGNPQPSSVTAQRDSRRQRLVLAGLIFLTAFGIRLLVWHNQRTEAPLVQTGVAENYKHLARLLQQNGLASFDDERSRPSGPSTRLLHSAGTHLPTRRRD